jgi:hypothetical protein
MSRGIEFRLGDPGQSHRSHRFESRCVSPFDGRAFLLELLGDERFKLMYSFPLRATDLGEVLQVADVFGRPRAKGVVGSQVSVVTGNQEASMTAFSFVHAFTGCGQKLNELVAPLILLAVSDEDGHVAVGDGGNHQNTGKYESKPRQHPVFNRSVLKGVYPWNEERHSRQDAPALM